MTCDYIASAETMRVTQVDVCGAPVPGANAFVADCFASIAMNPEIDTTDDVIYRAANGSLCAVKRGCDTLLGYNVEINVQTWSPQLIDVLTGNPTVLGFDAAVIGTDDCAAIQCQAGFALEFWSSLIEPTCSTTGNQRFLYTLLPRITGGYLNDLEIGSEAVSFQIVGKTRAGGNWGVGPYNVQAADAANTPGPMLTPLGTTCHRRMMLTSIQPPTDSCDYVTVPTPAP